MSQKQRRRFLENDWFLRRLGGLSNNRLEDNYAKFVWEFSKHLHPKEKVGEHIRRGDVWVLQASGIDVSVFVLGSGSVVDKTAIVRAITHINQRRRGGFKIGLRHLAAFYKKRFNRTVAICLAQTRNEAVIDCLESMVDFERTSASSYTWLYDGPELNTKSYAGIGSNDFCSIHICDPEDVTKSITAFHDKPRYTFKNQFQQVSKREGW